MWNQYNDDNNKNNNNNRHHCYHNELEKEPEEEKLSHPIDVFICYNEPACNI